MIALIENGEPIFSVIYFFPTDEMFVAEKGGGATCNNKPISVSARNLNQSFISFESDLKNEKNKTIREKLRAET